MTEKILAILFVFISKIIASTGYAGIVILMAIESACIPLPSEVIMPFAGYLVSVGQFSLIGAATMLAGGEEKYGRKETHRGESTICAGDPPHLRAPARCRRSSARERCACTPAPPT